jgi:hypothetical protein
MNFLLHADEVKHCAAEMCCGMNSNFSYTVYVTEKVWIFRECLKFLLGTVEKNVSGAAA